jgi:lipopolysaccharide transport system ATP-binding protein
MKATQALSCQVASPDGEMSVAETALSAPATDKSDNIAISVAGLGKAYRLDASISPHSREKFYPSTLGDAIMQRLRNPFHRRKRETVWALRDVSFDIYSGEIVGIIGANGAGKSTLLKIFSSITDPTTGQVNLYGPVSSLLEVGSGFHPELSGRENIYLNGALIGMKRREINCKLDAIVEFAGIARYLDTPLKKYSSGMSLRLAFAVAAHLDSDIVILDEVLAVGDVAFQAQCMSKMREIAQSGRTVLIVSHDMRSISTLCSRAIVLERGAVVFDGVVDQAIKAYLKRNRKDRSRDDTYQRVGSGEWRIASVFPSTETFAPNEPKEVVIRMEQRAPFHEAFSVLVQFVNQRGLVVAECDSRLVNHFVSATDSCELRARLHSPWLHPGEYTLNCVLMHVDIIDRFDQAATLHVEYPAYRDGERQWGHAGATGLVCSDFSFL